MNLQVRPKKIEQTFDPEMCRECEDNILTYPSPANVYISSQQVQPTKKGDRQCSTF